MKISLATTILMILYSQAAAFTPVATSNKNNLSASKLATATQLSMFGGAGAGAPAEDDEEGEKQIAQAAAAMGLPVAEYKMAMQARAKLQNAMDSKIVVGGKADTVSVERDVNNPPKKFEIKITEAGKALGREAVSKELVAALNTAAEASKKGRQEAQQEMMKWVQSQALPGK
jgi:hypothetical protein